MKMLFPLLLPGTVFCILAGMEQLERGIKPVIRVFGKTLPVWLVYVIILIAGPLILALMLAQAIQRRL